MKDSGFTSLPVYRNSLVLRDMSGALAQYFTPDQSILKVRTLGLRTSIADSLAEDASLIPTTIEKAYRSNSILERQKNATFINIITRNIISYCNGLEHDGVKEKEYIQLLRRELKTFRRSFKQWRKSLLHD